MANWNPFSGRDRSDVNYIIRYLILGCVLYTVSGIQLEGLSTKKPRQTKYSRTTPSPVDNSALVSGSLVGPQPPPAPPATPSTSALYRVNSSSGATCILLKTDALLSIKYTNKLGERVEADLFVPDEANVSGNCRFEDTETMTMIFKDFKLIWSFAKTPGGERWYVSGMELQYNTNNKLFEHVDKKNVQLSLTTPTRHATLLFPTPVGKSFGCTNEMTIDLENYDPSTQVDQKATVFLRDFQLQAFMYKAKNAFGPIFQCSASGSARDETAPIAVGATLSVAVLCTVTGYGIFRYLKVKKVQYDTMEGT